MRIPAAICDRRSILAAGAGLAAMAALAGCSSPGSPEPALPASPDDQSVDRAIEAAQRLRTQALALAALQPALAALLRQIAGDHAAHLAALGGAASATATARGTPASTTAAAPTAPSSSGAAAPAGSPAEPSSIGSPAPSSTGSPPAPGTGPQIRGEWDAGREALRDAASASAPGLGVLLARITAARAVHADLISAAAGRASLPDLIPAPAPVAATPGATGTTRSPAPQATLSPAAATTATAMAGMALAGTSPVAPDQVTTPSISPSPPDTPWLKALDRLLAGEHAAVFAYPLIIARLSGRTRAMAEQLWQDHQASRNDLTQILVTSSAAPSPAAPAYAIGSQFSAGPGARRLASQVELGLTALAADAVAVAAIGPQRRYAANHLVVSARRAAAWSGDPVPLPGLAAPTPAPSSPGSASPSGSAGPSTAEATPPGGRASTTSQ